MKTRLPKAAFSILCLSLIVWTSGRAQGPSSLAEVRGLIQAGRLNEASKEIARQLQGADPAPGMQLLQCVVLAQQSQTDKAIVCLNELIKKRPDTLEAYNNLGVLYASKGQVEEAQKWFTLALQRQPTTWTLHQNLQNLQADMSRKAYARALQAEMPLKDAPPKLTMLATAVHDGAPAQVPATIKTPKAKLAEPASPPALPTATKQISGGEYKSEDANVALTGPNKTDPATKAKGMDETTRQQLQDAVQAWAQAWSSQNMNDYFAAYTPDYTPSKSITREAWQSERRDRIAGRQFVRVKVSNFSFEDTGKKVIARFNQVYESDNIQSKHRKRLELVLLEGSWKIARETVISN